MIRFQSPEDPQLSIIEKQEEKDKQKTQMKRARKRKDMMGEDCPTNDLAGA